MILSSDDGNIRKVFDLSSEKGKDLNITGSFINYLEKEVQMGTVIVKNAVKRKSGYLYYVDGKGNVCEAKMSRGGRKKKRK